MTSLYYPDEAAIVHIGECFAAHTLPKEEWTHAAHFAAAIWLLRTRPDIEPERDMPDMIRSYNESVGGVNSDTGGEVAIPKTLEKDLVPDSEGYLAVDEEKIHIGALFPGGVDGVDAVVNTKWGQALGLPEDNAVLINTGLSSPQVVRKKIENAFGKDRFSISALDIVAQSGIDPGTYQQAIPVGAFSDAVGVFRYTPIGGGRIAPDPAWVKAHIVTEVVPILGSVTCNRYLMPQLKAALAEIVTSKLADKIHPGEYAGCYYPRFIAGSTQLSNHSFGLALDLNVPGNQRGTVGQMDRVVVAIFKKWGFAWGGDWAYTDPMHFELARIVNPG